MKQCGIYIIKNKINDLVYVGQSVNISVRWSAHKRASKNLSQPGNNTDIHKAMNKLGIDNFYCEILELCSFEQLSEKEKYWILYYNSYNKGYNMTPGGNSNIGEANGRSILTVSQVEDIRMCYNEKIPFKKVYEKYKDIISKRGLQKVWHFKTWRHIMPEVYTEENRLWHSTHAKSNINGNTKLGVNNKQRACSEEEISRMRELRKKGLSYNKISNILNRSPSVIRKYCLFQECKNNNKNPNSIRVKNLETGLCFDSLTEASKWANCDRHSISKNLFNKKSAGIVPTTNEPAHWIKL